MRGARASGRAAAGGGDGDAFGDFGGADVDVDAAVSFRCRDGRGHFRRRGACSLPNRRAPGDAGFGDAIGIEDIRNGPAAPVGGEDLVGGVHLHSGRCGGWGRRRYGRRALDFVVFDFIPC